MKPLFSLKRFGNTTISDIDLLIFLPHVSEDRDFLPLVRETATIPLDHISDEWLFRLLRHEADTGTREVTDALIEGWNDSQYALAVLAVEIPRGFCDLNRPRDRAVFPLLDTEKWLSLYDCVSAEIAPIISSARCVLHLHSMNNYNAENPVVFDASITESTIRAHLEKVYTGGRRSCTILTENTEYMPVTDPRFDALLRQHFYARNIALEENTAYRFIDGYPCTDIAKHIPSSFLEITKGSLSTPEWQDAIDTSLIAFDPDRVSSFANLLSAAIGDYLSTQK